MSSSYPDKIYGNSAKGIRQNIDGTGIKNEIFMVTADCFKPCSIFKILSITT